jgi:hypothetical protein
MWPFPVVLLQVLSNEMPKPILAKRDCLAEALILGGNAAKNSVITIPAKSAQLIPLDWEARHLATQPTEGGRPRPIPLADKPLAAFGTKPRGPLRSEKPVLAEAYP